MRFGKPGFVSWLGGCFLALMVFGWASQASALGLLIPQDTSLPPLAVKSHKVTIDVTDQASVTKVEQVFVNHTNRPLEATFVFPVPPGATVSDFSLWINGKKSKGTVMDRDKARNIYEGIVRRAQDPGLIEYMDGTLFRARIFPVPAKGTQKLEISFAQVLEQDGSVRRLLYPLKTGKKSARLMEDFSVQVNVSSRAQLKAIYSPSHKIDVRRKGDHNALVGVEESGADLEKDFLLYMATGEEDIGVSLLTYDEDGPGGESGYYLMVLSPRFEIKEEELPGQTVTFVVDTSGSMAGEKMEQAREALRQCLARLRPVDKFNIVRFSTDVEKLFGAPVQANQEMIKRGMEFAGELEAAGGTSIDDALSEALSASVGTMKHQVIFMTDGRPTVGATHIPTIVKNVSAKNRHNARIFTFGVGFKVNTTLLDSIARDHGGTADYVRPSEDIEVKVSSLYNRIAYPVMTDIKIHYGDARAYDVYPRQAPDLFRGGQAVIMGRFRKDVPDLLTVKGILGHQDVTLEFEEEGGDESDEGSQAHDFIPRLWATRKVGYLLEEIRNHGENAELKQEVIRLARKFGLVTPYTSYLAVDDSELEGRPQPVRPPVGIRRPWDNGPGFEEVIPEAEEDQLTSEKAPSRAAPRARAELKKRSKAERALSGGSGGFGLDTGEAAVETSMALDGFKKAESAAGVGGLRTRTVAGKLFVFSGGAWKQDGIKGSPFIKIKTFSKAYFNLLKAHPKLRGCLSLGSRVILKVGGKVVEVGPAGKEEVPVEKIRKW